MKNGLLGPATPSAATGGNATPAVSFYEWIEALVSFNAVTKNYTVFVTITGTGDDIYPQII